MKSIGLLLVAAAMCSQVMCRPQFPLNFGQQQPGTAIFPQSAIGFQPFSFPSQSLIGNTFNTQPSTSSSTQHGTANSNLLGSSTMSLSSSNANDGGVASGSSNSMASNFGGQFNADVQNQGQTFSQPTWTGFSG